MKHRNPPTRRVPKTRQRLGMRGMTLIELLIVVAIIAILGSIAFPSFMDSVRKSRRSEAFTALNSVQQAQERFRGNNATYASSLTGSPTDSTPSARGLGLSTPTPSGYYAISLSNVTATSYEAVATAVSGTSQANDGDCAKLGVKLDGGNLQYAAAAGGGSLSWGGANRCWSR